MAKKRCLQLLWLLICTWYPSSMRLFFGCEVIAPWPEEFPEGRLVPETSRHMTAAFLGNIDYSRLESLLPDFPKPPYQVSPAGTFDRCLFLPPRNPRVVSWHATLETGESLLAHQKNIAAWLTQKGYRLERRDFLPHVTVARHPFAPSHWKKSFMPLPMMVRHVCLYESVGQLTYEPRWQQKFIPPFEEIEHTADRAFLVRGKNLWQIHRNAQVALAFIFPGLIPYFSHLNPVSSLEDIVIDLNHVLSRADQDVGCPLKAVSFHGEVQEIQPGVLQWEMICDV